MDPERVAPFTDIIAITLATHAEKSAEERFICRGCCCSEDIADNMLCHTTTTLIGL